MLVTPSEIVTLVRLVQSENALRPMLVTLPGITTEVKYFFMFSGIVFLFISSTLDKIVLTSSFAWSLKFYSSLAFSSSEKVL